MSARLGTVVFLVSLIACIAIYDVLILKTHGGRATISSVILGAVFDRPWGALIPLLIGVLIGHLLWSQPCPPR